ncbi:hypothetical protein DFJ69_3652 [Thermomonospora umbrina]|uniref:Uncharacterized protein n=1 Tax=Thermomonospora umbrina TaxID=111806 RepID=A0A3D9SQV3_9ACTN|nr:hypothetical protein DFJ69_3652 [Thermomonospora umbrina]
MIKDLGHRGVVDKTEDISQWGFCPVLQAGAPER